MSEIVKFIARGQYVDLVSLRYLTDFPNNQGKKKPATSDGTLAGV